MDKNCALSKGISEAVNSVALKRDTVAQLRSMDDREIRSVTANGRDSLVGKPRLRLRQRIQRGRSAATFDYDFCLADMTTARTKQLQEMLDQIKAREGE